MPSKWIPIPSPGAEHSIMDSAVSKSRRPTLAEMSLWSNSVSEPGDTARDCAPTAGLGDAVVECGEDAGIACHERPEAHQEHNSDNQREDATDGSCDGLSGVGRAFRPSAGYGNAAENSREQASQQAKREQDEG